MADRRFPPPTSSTRSGRFRLNGHRSNRQHVHAAHHRGHDDRFDRVRLLRDAGWVPVHDRWWQRAGDRVCQGQPLQRLHRAGDRGALPCAGQPHRRRARRPDRLGSLAMPIVYEVPTHLNVSDTIVFGLGAHQLVRLAAGGSLAYVVWDQASALPPELRATIAGLLVAAGVDRKSTRLNSSHEWISYAVFCLNKKKKTYICISVEKKKKKKKYK